MPETPTPPTNPLLDKLKATLTSRRFWALIIALITVGSGLATSQVRPDQAVTDAAGALAAYMLSVGIGG